jgi:hypothetical protein
MQQSYTGAANLQTPGQFEQGTEAAQQGVTQALGAGQNYANMATNPNAIQAYMNPYIQQSLAPQLSLLNQQQALGGQNIAANAVGKGAFGGNREALAQGLNAQNYDLARQSAIGQGYNNAFNAATQAQQYGAGLGLQGAQSAIQGAQTLGQLGAGQNQANLGIVNAQNQLGLQQYNLPAQLLEFQKNMMSNLPYSNQTQQGWQAPPNALSQTTGLLGTAGTLGLLANKMGMFNDLKNPFTSGSNPYPAQENNGAQTGEVWGSPGNQDASYGNLGQSSVMQNPVTPDTLNFASGGIVSLALDKASKGRK